MKMNKQFSHLVALLAAIMLLPSMVVAQDDGPGFIEVRTMVVKPSRVGDYLALQAEFAAPVHTDVVDSFHSTTADCRQEVILDPVVIVAAPTVGNRAIAQNQQVRFCPLCRRNCELRVRAQDLKS